MGFVTLLALLQALTQNTRSVDEAVARIPPSWRARFVLMEKSRSLQEASPDAPRVVLFDEEGTVMLSFNGEPGQRGYATLEAVAYDPRTLQYEIRSVSYAGGSPKISGPNPEICLRCHRSVPRPNWEPFPHWPGALGQSVRYSREEWRRLQDFARKQSRHGRYGHLNFAEHGRLFSRVSPAFALSGKLTLQAVERVSRLLMASPEYGRFRFALAGALADCPDWERAVPGGLLPIPLSRYVADLVRRYRLLPREHQAVARPEVGNVVAKLRYLLEPRGFSVDWLTLSFTERYFLSAAGSVPPHLLSRLGELDPALGLDRAPWEALNAHFNGTPTADQRRAHGGFCAGLASTSRKALGG